MKTRQDKINADLLGLIVELTGTVRDEHGLLQGLQDRLARLERIVYPGAVVTGCAIVHNPTALAVKEN